MSPTSISNLDRVAREISRDIENELNKIGLMYRILYRTKGFENLKEKIIRKGYENSDKNLQDLIGIRITSYFEDDLELVQRILRKKFKLVEETIDKWQDFEFKPIRINLIFNLKTDLEVEVVQTLKVNNILNVDPTVEVQLRTVLSEGWHEVDHDLRYHCKEDWTNYSDIARKFNSVLATLQLSDWGIIKIFDELAYNHYKNGNWGAMLRQKFRVRLSKEILSEDIATIFKEDKEIGKDLFKIDRLELLSKLYKEKIETPLNLNNLVFLINKFYLNNKKILHLTPSVLFE